MKIAALREHDALEDRVAVTPDSAKKLIQMGFEVIIEKDAGAKSSFTDQMYKEAGAIVSAAVKSADIYVKINPPTDEQRNAMDKGAALIALLNPYDRQADLKKYASAGIDTFGLELIPRISRAQSMDVLSSQSNLAGYRAVIEAATVYNKAFPLMMTAAGTIAPARVLVLGAGVAGLQAIATARRLGAVVSAFDVRRETREQVESLGAFFVEVESDEEGSGQGGYAKEMSEDYKKRQAQKIHDILKETDIAISTALIPGRPAPELITEAMVRDMPEGSVIVDMAAARGGNCKLTVADKITEKHGVQIIGYTNLPGRVARDASQLFGRNLFNFLKEIYDAEKKSLKTDWENPVFKETCLTHGGKIVHEKFGGKPAAKAA